MNCAAQSIFITHIHHLVEYLARFLFIHSDFSLSPLLINDFSLFPTESQTFMLHLMAFCVSADHADPFELINKLSGIGNYTQR